LRALFREGPEKSERRPAVWGKPRGCLGFPSFVLPGARRRKRASSSGEKKPPALFCPRGDRKFISGRPSPFRERKKSRFHFRFRGLRDRQSEILRGGRLGVPHSGSPRPAGWGIFSGSGRFGGLHVSKRVLGKSGARGPAFAGIFAGTQTPLPASGSTRRPSEASFPTGRPHGRLGKGW